METDAPSGDDTSPRIDEPVNVEGSKPGTENVPAFRSDYPDLILPWRLIFLAGCGIGSFSFAFAMLTIPAKVVAPWQHDLTRQEPGLHFPAAGWLLGRIRAAIAVLDHGWG